MKKYKQFNIYSTPYNPEILSGFLWDLEIGGFLDNDTFATVYTGENSTVSYEAIESILKLLQESGEIENYLIEVSEFEEKNWNEEWEKNLNIIKVTDNIIIRPSTKFYEKTCNELVITIDPKMSFGTGEHETTKIVLGLVEKNIINKKRVLDVGSGTAVLAIAAVKLGANYAVALDNDEWCHLNGNENTTLNNVEDKVNVVLGELKDLEEENFDLILANINKPILLDIKELIKNKLSPNGTLILSGLLITDEEDIVTAYNSVGLKVVDKTTMNEWMGLVLQ
ncbi:MAG TPA: 50S ribosomal protein L11 methyltransferase [Melioribacteraceae bacterium]|nr:50S ribosomal protein L11 methyltransferase [Melioribacteraceae bacterium]